MSDLVTVPGEQILTITRGQLKRLDACREGMRLFNVFVGGRNKNVLRIIWSPLAQVWFAKNHRDFAGWLYDCGVTPRFSLSSANLRSADLSWANLSAANLRSANLSWANLPPIPEGADLAGAWRTAEDAPVLGWHLRGGRLEKDAAK